MSGRNQKNIYLGNCISAKRYHICFYKYLETNKCSKQLFIKYIYDALLESPNQIFDFTKFYIPKKDLKRNLQVQEVDISMLDPKHKNLYNIVNMYRDLDEDLSTGYSRLYQQENRLKENKGKDEIKELDDLNTHLINSGDIIIISDLKNPKIEEQEETITVQLYINPNFVQTNKTLKDLHKKLINKYMNFRTSNKKILPQDEPIIFSLKVNTQICKYLPQFNSN